MRGLRPGALASGGDGVTDADAALLSQQLAMDRLQHGAAVATLTHRAEALEGQLAGRDEEVRQAHHSASAQSRHSNMSQYCWFASEDLWVSVMRIYMQACACSRPDAAAAAVQGRQGSVRCRCKGARRAQCRS